MKKLILISLPVLVLSASCIRKMRGCVAHERTPDCITTADISPVCGCDGKTYSNASEASCHGIKNYTTGECKTN